MGRHVRLDEQGGLLRIDAGRQQSDGHVDRLLSQAVGVRVAGGNRVEVDDRVERLEVVL